jgi:hypothetical protein
MRRAALEVAQVSKPAVSQCFQPANAANLQTRLETSHAQPIGNRRYSRFGNLRYDFVSRPERRGRNHVLMVDFLREK